MSPIEPFNGQTQRAVPTYVALAQPDEPDVPETPPAKPVVTDEYAAHEALSDDIDNGVVWLISPDSGVLRRRRCLTRLSNRRKAVYCEALEID